MLEVVNLSYSYSKQHVIQSDPIKKFKFKCVTVTATFTDKYQYVLIIIHIKYSHLLLFISFQQFIHNTDRNNV